MLDAIGVESIDELFDEIPSDLKIDRLKLPRGMGEMEISRLMRSRARQDGTPMCFAGAGAYEHHVPSAIWDIATRGEFYSAYTPYQAEASQGTLQVIYEYQSMMTALTGMAVSNASLYDGASALAEAILMAVRSNRKAQSRRILMPMTVHPVYRKVVHTLVDVLDIEIEEVAIDRSSGRLDGAALDAAVKTPFAALVIPQPNFFGVLEQVDSLTDLAHEHGGLVIGLVNPTALAILSPPGHWGQNGADMVCGEGQPLGIPLSSGGPYFGFLCCTQALVRQIPGRLVGRTTDVDGKDGFALTLQAREQHIRRDKAKSNICTNQGLMVTAATIYMAMMGDTGLEQVAAQSHQNLQGLLSKLAAHQIEPAFTAPVFHEVALRLPVAAAAVIERLAEQNIVAGYDLSRDLDDAENLLLVCVTETKTEADLDHFVAALIDACG